jgi:hypothetical protein
MGAELQSANASAERARWASEIDQDAGRVESAKAAAVSTRARARGCECECMHVGV